MTKKQVHYFSISGGVGKNIMATAVVRELKKKYPGEDIVLVTPHPHVWAHNPDIAKLVQPEVLPEEYKLAQQKEPLTAHFYNLEPYGSEDYFYQRKHLISLWCDLYGLPCKKTSPLLFVTDEEKDFLQKKIGSAPVFLIQTNGGAPNQPFPISWARDLPLHSAEHICYSMKQKGFRVIHLRRPNQYPLRHAEFLNLSMREVYALIAISSKRLLIDSFAQHAAAALGKPSVVVWISNPEKVFGYSLHENLHPDVKPEFRHRLDSFLEPYNITGAIHECPFSTDALFLPDRILESLQKLT